METTLATSLAEIGEVRAAPNGNLIVPSLAIDEAAMLEKRGSMNSVDLTCVTGLAHRANVVVAEVTRSFQLDSSENLHLRDVHENLKVGDFFCCGCRDSRSLKVW